MPAWVLAIDFGTSYTVAAVQVDGRAPEVIEIGGERRVPSVILIEPNGDIVVGRAADDLSVTHPASTLRALKNRLGDQSPVILGGRPHQVVVLVAALLRDIYEQVLRQMGDPPREVRLSHPATWNQPRLSRLTEAAVKAGLPHPSLVPEPVAAALSYASEVGMAEGQHVAVYDLGGGTFDSAVVTARAGQFVIVGRPSGDQHIGGELFDELIVDHVGQTLPGDVWEAIQVGEEPLWQQVGATLRNEARKAKEALSLRPYVDVIVPLPAGLSQTRLTRAELEAIVRPYVAETVSLLERCIVEAGLTAGGLTAISLVGGASRSPIVEEMVVAAFPGLTISRRGDPKAAVAIGAARAVMAPSAPPVRDVATHPASPGTAPEAVRLGPPTGPPAAPWPHATLAVPAAATGTVSDGQANGSTDEATRPRDAGPQPPADVPSIRTVPARSARSRRGAVVLAVFVVLVLAVVAGVVLAGRKHSTSRSADSAAAATSLDPALIVGGTGPVSSTGASAVSVAPDTSGPADSSVATTTDPETSVAAVPVGTELLTLSGARDQTLSAVFSPDGTQIATASLDGSARLWDAATGVLEHTLEGHSNEVYSVAFSPDSSRLVTASADRTARVWDTATGASLWLLADHTDVVYEASFSPDGGRIVTASADGTAKIWDTASGGLVATLRGHHEAVYTAAFSPNGALVATGSQDDTVMEWDPNTGQALLALIGHTADVQTVAFSADGILLASASDDGTVKIWDVASGTLQHTLSGHRGKVWMAVFSPDGTLVLSGGMDGSVRLWSIADGQPIYVDQPHDMDVYGVAFSPDGARYVAASLDGTATVWDVATHALLATLTGHQGLVFTAQYDPTGARIVTASSDGTAKVWAG